MFGPQYICVRITLKVRCLTATCKMFVTLEHTYDTTVDFETVTAVIDSDTSLPAPAELAYIIRLSRNSPHSSLSLCASLFSHNDLTRYCDTVGVLSVTRRLRLNGSAE